MCGQLRLERLILGQQQDLNDGSRRLLVTTSTERVDVSRRQELVLNHAPEQIQTLSPHQRHVVVRNPICRAGLESLGRDGRKRDVVELRKEALSCPLHEQAVQLGRVKVHLCAIVSKQGVEVQVGEKKWPLALDVLELFEFLRLVVQAPVVLQQSLMAIAQKALETVTPFEFGFDFASCLVHQLGVVHRKGGVSQDTEHRRVHFFAVGFPRQQRTKCDVRLSDVVRRDVKHAAAPSTRTKQVE